MPVGFVPLHCFCISLPFPPCTLSFSCDCGLSDKKHRYVALGQLALFTVPVLVSHMISITVYINLERHSGRIMRGFDGSKALYVLQVQSVFSSPSSTFLCSLNATAEPKARRLTNCLFQRSVMGLAVHDPPMHEGSPRLLTCRGICLNTCRRGNFSEV